MRRTDSLEKTLMLGKIEGKSRRGRQRIRWLDDITNSMGMKLGTLWEMEKDRKAWSQTVRNDLATAHTHTIVHTHTHTSLHTHTHKHACPVAQTVKVSKSQT